MKVLKKDVAFTGLHLRIVNKSFETDTGGKGVWETVERINIPEIGAVVVIALTRNKEVIFERNWRVPLESFVLQFPAGLIDKDDENEEETARRELLEETGYLAKRLVPITLAAECSALTPNQVNHYLATDVEFVGKEGSQTTEEIEVLKVPIRNLKRFMLNLPEDTILDLRVPGILWMLEKRKMI
ncbi:NUDIX hydrolase [Chloroflexota bacterium]